MQIVYKKTNDLIPYVNNTRTHSDEQVNQIASSIKEFGFTNPALIDADGGIIAGHGRVMAAKKLKMAEVPCIVLDGLSEAQKKAYIIADNKLALNAGWDEELLKLEIENLKELDFDIDLLGFNDAAINMMLADVDDFGEDFSLPDGEKTPIQQITFTLHDFQADLINSAIDYLDSNLGEDEIETFGNTNKRGNLIYMAVKKWAEQKKL